MCGFMAQLVEHHTSICGGHRFESHWSPGFFRLLLSNCSKWKIYCDNHSSLSFTTAVQIWIYVYFTKMSLFTLLLYSRHHFQGTGNVQGVQDDALCIRSRISPPWTLNSSLITSSTSMDHPPRTSMKMLYCRMSYPGNCCLSSQEGGILGGLLFLFLCSVLRPRATHFYCQNSLLLTSTMSCLTCSLTVKTGISQMNMLRPQVTCRWVCKWQENTIIIMVALYQRLKLSKHFPEQYFEGRIILWCQRRCR